MERIKIGYFADGPWSHRAFEKIIKEKSILVVFIVPRSDSKDDTLKNLAEYHGIEYIKGYNINSEEFLSLVTKHHCDLFVSMSFNQIFKPRIFNLPPLKTINCHAGKLPYYRGRNILNWALINDEKEFGITVHYIDEGIDTGDIILQDSHVITDSDNYNTLLNRSFEGCADILFRSILKIRDGENERIEQNSIHSVGMYFGARGVGDEIINWNQTSRELFNFIRAICKPGPKAHTMLKEKLVKIEAAVEIKDAIAYKAIPGQIVGKEGTDLIVKTGDSTIRITDYQSEIKPRVGDRFKG